MTILTFHGRELETVFDLLGYTENDLTAALGWTLSQSPTFLEMFGKKLGLKQRFSSNVSIRLQEHRKSHGITDVEIYDPGKHHIIVEAKRGFTIPSDGQLNLYSDRLSRDLDQSADRLLVVLAESDRRNIWLENHLPKSVGGIPIKPISWSEFKQLARRASCFSNQLQKQLLRQFLNYLSRATAMQNHQSNLVYVVSLNNKTFGCGDTTFIDVVERHKKYFHPVGGTGRGGWPSEPPNYLGFRYHGELKSICHIQSYEVINNYKPYFTAASVPLKRPHFLYKLGRAIKPSRRVPTNGRAHSIFPAGRRWVFIDLLLTSPSVADAAILTKKRRQQFDAF